MTLVDNYLNALMAFEEATFENDQKTARKYYKVMDTLFRNLRDSGRLGELMKFIDHQDDRVKLWAATHLLVFNEQAAKEALTKIANDNDNLLGFTAEMTLQEWGKGNLTYLVE